MVKDCVGSGRILFISLKNLVRQVERELVGDGKRLRRLRKNSFHFFEKPCQTSHL